MTQRAIWLGQRLQALRSDAGMTLQEAGDYLGRNPSSVSRSESGETPARVGDVIALMNLYGVDDPHERSNMEQLAREVWQRGWWEPYRKELPTKLMDYAWLEEHASEIRSYEAMGVPGLLQTPEYAEAVIREFDPDADDIVQTGIEFRMKRQDVFDGEDPPRYLGIIDEAALRRPVGGTTVMRGQLRKVLAMADRDTVELRVLPLAAGAHAGHLGSFQIFTQRDPLGEIGYAETLAGSIYLESGDVSHLTRAFDRLLAATDPRTSVEMIRNIEKGLE
jgi:transcriptional regulator with XRE-family HTH domain